MPLCLVIQIGEVGDIVVILVQMEQDVMKDGHIVEIIKGLHLQDFQTPQVARIIVPGVAQNTMENIMEHGNHTRINGVTQIVMLFIIVI